MKSEPRSHAPGTPCYIRFLSQNRSEQRMGMGHYERLLIQHLSENSSDTAWRYDITFNGRTPTGDGGGNGARPRLQRRASSLGFSTERLHSLPWSVVRAVMNVGMMRWPQPTLYHSLALSYPLPSMRPGVLTIHDLPPLRFDDEGKLPRWAQRAAHEARAIVTPSEFAKREVMDLLHIEENKMHVVYYGCEHDRFHPEVKPADPAVLATYGITGPFLVYVGGFTKRKNVRALLEAWALVAPSYPDLSLVLVGPAAPLQLRAQEVKAPRVTIAGYLGRDVLPGLMKASKGLVFPSIYEGFGLPPLEAMALGIPVVAVRAGAIPEVVGDAGILGEDGAPETIAGKIRLLLDDDQLARRLSAAGPGRAAHFSWQAHARDVLDIYLQVIG